MARPVTHRTPHDDAAPAAPDGGITYADHEWDEETFALFAEGRDPPACPRCGRTGFYGPRVADGAGRHRSCRFCGFFQRVNGPPEQATPTVHGCGPWPQVARAPYVWWVEPGRTTYTCAFCGESVDTAAHAITPPQDDPAHPWWRVPQQRSRSYYGRFWENWPYTKGRAFL